MLHDRRATGLSEPARRRHWTLVSSQVAERAVQRDTGSLARAALVATRHSSIIRE
jgi:hypothetical protein